MIIAGLFLFAIYFHFFSVFNFFCALLSFSIQLHLCLFICLFIFVHNFFFFSFFLPPILLFLPNKCSSELWIAWSLVIFSTCIYVRFNAFYHRYWFVMLHISQRCLVRFSSYLVSHAYNFNLSLFLSLFLSISLFRSHLTLSLCPKSYFTNEYDWNRMQSQSQLQLQLNS